MTEPFPLESRLIEVEIQLMHLQRDYEHLNAECVRQQNLLFQQQRRIEALEQLMRERFDCRDATSGESEDAGII